MFSTEGGLVATFVALVVTLVGFLCPPQVGSCTEGALLISPVCLSHPKLPFFGKATFVLSNASCLQRHYVPRFGLAGLVWFRRSLEAVKI